VTSTPRTDPAIKRLRIASVVVFLVLIAFIVVDGEPDNPATFGSLVGAALVSLGFEIGFRLPGSPKGPDDEGGKS
jgi:hypothetical protein